MDFCWLNHTSKLLLGDIKEIFHKFLGRQIIICSWLIEALLFHLYLLTGFENKFPGHHGWWHRINSGAVAYRTGVLVHLADFNQTGAFAGVAFLAPGVKSFTIAIHTAMGMVRGDTAVVHPPSPLTFGTGFRCAFPGYFGLLFSLHKIFPF
jgi:hypothetical protein